MKVSIKSVLSALAIPTVMYLISKCPEHRMNMTYGFRLSYVRFGVILPISRRSLSDEKQMAGAFLETGEWISSSQYDLFTATFETNQTRFPLSISFGAFRRIG